MENNSEAVAGLARSLLLPAGMTLWKAREGQIPFTYCTTEGRDLPFSVFS